MQRGWIKSWRKQYDRGHWLMKSSRPFCHMAAWQDLICLADYQTGTVDKSQSYLARRWGWTRSKVRRFIEKLKADDMVNPTIEPTTKSTILSIVNYGKYQSMPTTKSTGKPTISKEDKEVQLSFSKEKQPFSLPSKEEISESATNKIEQDINSICKQLVDENIFAKAYTFKGKMFKEGKNPRAILHALSRCYLAKPSNAFAYCAKIMGVEEGNYNERDYQKSS